MIDGSGRYNSRDRNQIEYDLETAIAQTKATIQGETIVKTGQTKTKVLIKDLALADVATLLPHPPVNLSSGNLNANLDINIPSFAHINDTKVTGKLSLRGLSGEVKDLSAPIKARSNLNFKGDTAEVDETKASLGEITAQLSGTVNWQKGYDLAIDILPVRLSGLTKILPMHLPADTQGELTAKLQVMGDITEPVVKGKINNTKSLKVAKSQFRKLQADFTADFQRFRLNDLNIIPVAGGEISAEGIIATNLKGSIANGIPIDMNTMVMALNFNAQLPTQKIISPYYQLPTAMQVGGLLAEGKIGGTIHC